MSKKVLVLMGGFSAERDVSLSSGDDIAKALLVRGYDAFTYDLRDGWDLIATLQKEKPDVVFNGLYGNWGEDGEIQGLLDMLQIPYTHSGLKTSAIGMDKELTRKIAADCGIKIAAAEKMTAGDFMTKGTKIPLPYVVKPVCDGSSVGVFIVRDAADLKSVAYADWQREVLVEQFIPGQELTVMCLDGKAYAVTELRPKAAFYDYKAKYTNGVTEHILPAEISAETAATCLDHTEKLYRALGCNAVARCDFRYNPQDGVVLLEINTNPGMTSLSLVPEQARYAGIAYEELCVKLVETAQCRKIQSAGA